MTAIAVALTQGTSEDGPADAAEQRLATFRVALPGQRGAASARTAPGIGTDTASGARLPFEPLVPGRADTAAVVQPTATAAADPAPAAPGGEWSNVAVAPGDNLSLIFSRLQLSKAELHEVVTADSERRALRHLKPGQNIRLRSDGERLNTLVLELDQLNSLWFQRTAEGFTTRVETVVPEIRTASATNEITHSLFVDGQRVGLSDAMIMRLTEIFGWDIDFALDLRQHDRFSVIYEEIFKDGERVKDGRILAAEFVNRGRNLRAVLFTDEDGEAAYYSEAGHPMRKAFLRTPVNFTRISSKFNLGRRHPILNTIRAHRGVDYAAPMGTPVRATANGSVRMAGRNGGYGLSVEVQHGQSYRTLYAHLSRFAKGLKRGSTVRQGQVIGYVGKTGLATGPHLHYEFRIDGVHRNPLTVELPRAAPLDARRLAEFRQHTAPYFAQLDTLYAANDEHARERARLVARVEQPDGEQERSPKRRN